MNLTASIKRWWAGEPRGFVFPGMEPDVARHWTARACRAIWEFARVMHCRTIKPVTLGLGLVSFVYFVLVLAQWGNGGSCHWAFPKWFGCALSTHENLAAGLIGASGALLAAWVAWSAVQQQINAERERLMEDRVEAERLLADEMTDYADGMAAAWRLLEKLVDGEGTHNAEAIQRFRQAVAYMASRLSRPEHIANYRVMANTLGGIGAPNTMR